MVSAPAASLALSPDIQRAHHRGERSDLSVLAFLRVRFPSD
jgi:hypothetical protein